MTILYVLSILIVLSSAIAIYFKYSPDKKGFFFFKPITTILIIVFALLADNPVFNNLWFLVPLGLLFCLGGDIFLMIDKFLLGLLSFLIGHIIFLLYFLVNADTYNIIITVPLFLIGVILFLFLYKKLGKMKIPVIIYLLVIILMAWSGISLYLVTQKEAGLLISIAVLLFVFSDANIAFNRFNKKYKAAEFLILSTYYISIYLIALSLHV